MPNPETNETESSQPQVPEEILSALTQEAGLADVHPAQDFVNGKLYYGCTIQGQSYLVASDRTITPLDRLRERGLRSMQPDVHACRFSSQGISDYVQSSRVVDAGQLFQTLVDYLKRYIHLTDSKQYYLVALWVMATYQFTIFRYFPYLHIWGEKGSGKSLLGSFLVSLAFNGKSTVSTTPAVVFRYVDRSRSTLVIDEAERLQEFGTEGNGAVMEVLRQGFMKSGTVMRCVGRQYEEIQAFSTYSPKVIVGINHVENVLADRAIGIRMLRRLGSESIERYTESHEQVQEANRLVDDLYLFGLSYAESVARVYHDSLREVPGIHKLQNRSADLWTPLIVLAHVVDGGAGWLSSQMIQLAVEHGRDRMEEDEIANRTVTMIRAIQRVVHTVPPIREERGVKYVSTDAAWDCISLEEGFLGITKNKLSREMRRLGFSVKPIRCAGRVEKTYAIDLAVLSDLVSRYITEDESVTVTQSVTGNIGENDLN